MFLVSKVILNTVMTMNLSAQSKDFGLIATDKGWNSAYDYPVFTKYEVVTSYAYHLAQYLWVVTEVQIPSMRFY